MLIAVDPEEEQDATIHAPNGGPKLTFKYEPTETMKASKISTVQDTSRNGRSASFIYF